MKKLKTPTAVTTAVLTLITLFFWAGFEIYRSLTVKQAPTVPEAIINPIDPNLDTATLGKLQTRLFLNDSEIGNTVPSIAPITPSPEPLVTEVPEASPSASATSSATPTATP